MGLIGRGRRFLARGLAVAVAVASVPLALPVAANADVYQCRRAGGEYRSICANVTDAQGALPLRLGAGYGDTVPGTGYHNGDALALACWTTGPPDASGAGDRYWLQVYDTLDTSIEGFVSDYNLTTGTTTAWQRSVSHCTDPVPQTGKPYQCRMQGGEYRSWCANVTDVPEDMWLPLDTKPAYGSVVSGTTYHNGDSLALGCWTTGPADYGDHGDTYWFSVFDPNDPSIEGYVNDYSLTTGSPSDWRSVVSACQGTTPPQCDTSVYRTPVHSGVPEALTADELRCTTPFARSSTEANASALSSRLGRVTLTAMMRGAPYRTTSLNDWTFLHGVCGASKAPTNATEHGFCWRSTEQSADEFPQGLTSSEDATGSTYDGHSYLAMSWHISGKDNGKPNENHRSRVTFVNMDRGPVHPVHAYQHALLVTPNSDGTGCTPLESHADGMVWYGDKLILADGSTRSLRVFDLTNLSRAGSGCHDGGYRYVLPQSEDYAPAVSAGGRHMSVNWVSLIRGDTPSLLVGEWQGSQTGHSLVVRYPLDASTGLPSEDGGVATATSGYRTGLVNAQGGLIHNGRLYIGASNDDSNGYLYTWDMTLGDPLATHVWGEDTENLALFGGRLWGLSELIHHRSVFSVPESSYS